MSNQLIHIIPSICMTVLTLVAQKSAPASEQQFEEDCINAINHLKQKIQASGALVSSTRLYEEPSPNNPFKEGISISLILGTRDPADPANLKNNQLMNSTPTQIHLAESVFDDCPEVVSLGFLMSRTSWTTRIFRTVDQTAIPGRCIAAARGIEWPEWGSYSCP